MRVLVTGGAGFIGSHTCKALAEAGHEPVTYDNLRTGHRHTVRWGPFEHGDIHDPHRLSEAIRTHRAEAIIHFAALAYVGESVARPDLYYRTNVAGTLNVIEAARAAGIARIVFSSTCATYGVPAKTPIDETMPQQPVNPYGRSKLMVEHILADHAAAFGIGAIALRYFNAAGADPAGELGEEHDPETHLIPLVLQAAAGRLPHIGVLGDDYATPDGTCIRDYTHVSDLAAAHVRAIDRCESGAFLGINLGTGAGHSVREVIETARRVTGCAIPERIAPRRPGDPPALIADASLAHAKLDWTARHDLPQMIEHAWTWMRRNAR